jgi:hypothetical protein
MYANHFWTVVKEENLKKYNNLNYGLSSLLLLNPISYQNNSGNKTFTHIGLEPQKLHEVIPEAVYKPQKTGEKWSINYNQLIPVLIKGIQEQQQEMETVKAENQELKQRLESIENRLAKLEQ